MDDAHRGAARREPLEPGRRLSGEQHAVRVAVAGESRPELLTDENVAPGSRAPYGHLTGVGKGPYDEGPLPPGTRGGRRSGSSGLGLALLTLSAGHPPRPGDDSELLSSPPRVMRWGVRPCRNRPSRGHTRRRRPERPRRPTPRRSSPYATGEMAGRRVPLDAAAATCRSRRSQAPSLPPQMAVPGSSGTR